jgi:hypothetical protein
MFLFVLFSAVLSGPTAAQCTDQDADGYFAEERCGTPRDCNDADPRAHPGAEESCNGVDDNCDGQADENCDPSCDDARRWMSTWLAWGVKISDPSLASTGSGYGVAYDSDDPEREIYFMRLDAFGGQVGSTVNVTENTARSANPSLVWTGSEFAVAWEDARDGNEEIYFARFDSEGAPIGPNIRVTFDEGRSTRPHLLWNGTEYGVIWADDRDGAGSIYFAALDRSGERTVSDVKITKGKSESRNPFAVWNGFEYAVVWEQRGREESEIYFARLTAAGKNIGPSRQVTDDNAASTNPVLVWNGEGYGVAWEDGGNGASSPEVYLASLDAAGERIGADVRVTEDDGTRSFGPRLAWASGEYGLIWRDRQEDALHHDLYLVRLDKSGERIGARVLVSSYDSSLVFIPSRSSLLWNGSEFAVSWQQPPYEFYPSEPFPALIGFALIRCCGNDADTDGYGACDDCDEGDPATFPGAPEMCNGKDNNCDSIIDNKDTDLDGYIDEQCMDGSDCDDEDHRIFPGALEYCDEIDNDCDNLVDEELYRDADGDAHYPFRSCVPPSDDCNDANPFVHPGMTETCNGYDDDCSGLLDEGCDTTCDGRRRWSWDLRKTWAPGHSSGHSVAWTGSEYGVAWSDERHGDYELYFRRMDSSGADIGPEIKVSFQGAHSSLVWTGSEYGIVWEGEGKIFFSRLDASGNKIGTDLQIASARDPVMVWSGTEYGLAWRYGQTLVFARLDISGNRVGPDRTITSDGHEHALVWTGDGYGVAWSRLEGRGVRFAQLDASGMIIRTDVPVSDTAAYRTRHVSLAWSGSEYGIAWVDSRRSHWEYLFDVYFARLDATGNKIGGDSTIATAPWSNGYQDPSVVWTGSEYGVAFGGYQNILFARVDASGNRIGGHIEVSDPWSGGFHAEMVWTGKEFGIVWPDFRHPPDYDYEIYFNKVVCPEGYR